VTTDASKFAVAAILSQIQNGIERPIAYDSKQMNKAEQAYSASESEMLALKLSELDFTEQRPGTKIAHVDALSRHVGAVIGVGTISQESVLREQAKDKFCAKIKLENYTIKCQSFIDDVGLVYRRQPNNNHQLLVPQT
jgi:hypothetical protein